MFQRHCALLLNRSLSSLTTRTCRFAGRYSSAASRTVVSFSPRLHRRCSSSSLLLPVLLLVSGGGGSRPYPFCSSAFSVGAVSRQTTLDNHSPVSPHVMFRRGRANTASSSFSTPQSSPPSGSRSGGLMSSTSNGGDGGDEVPTKWESITSLQTHLQRTVPTLSSSCHKGSSGRVGVLGGSAQYTGAPYYAAMSALRTGADLAFVFCAEEAAVPIKAYSPELMVASVYKAHEFDELVKEEKRLREEVARDRAQNLESVIVDKQESMDSVSLDDNKDDQGADPAEELARVEEQQQRVIDDMVASVTETFDRLHMLIVGPGLGRCPLVLRATAKIIAAAKERKLPMVIDADGLYLLTLKENTNLVAGYQGLVLTPNAVEVKRLTQAMMENDKEGDGTAEGGQQAAVVRSPTRAAWADSPEKAVSEMSAFEKATEGVVIVKKGAMDVIFSTSLETLTVSRKSMLCEEQGGLKRSGGLGDILSGCIGTFVAWNQILQKKKVEEGELKEDVNARGNSDLLLGCWSACCITKRATRHAFEKKRRGMTAPDVLEELAGTVDEMTGDSIIADDEK